MQMYKNKGFSSFILNSAHRYTPSETGVRWPSTISHFESNIACLINPCKAIIGGASHITSCNSSLRQPLLGCSRLCNSCVDYIFIDASSSQSRYYFPHSRKLCMHILCGQEMARARLRTPQRRPKFTYFYSLRYSHVDYRWPRGTERLSSQVTRLHIPHYKCKT